MEVGVVVNVFGTGMLAGDVHAHHISYHVLALPPGLDSVSHYLVYPATNASFWLLSLSCTFVHPWRQTLSRLSYGQNDCVPSTSTCLDLYFCSHVPYIADAGITVQAIPVRPSNKTTSTNQKPGTLDCELNCMQLLQSQATYANSSNLCKPNAKHMTACHSPPHTN
jgi:hypothetical protein